MRAAASLALVLLATAACRPGREPGSPEPVPSAASATAPAAATPPAPRAEGLPLVRGVVIVSGEAPRLTPCGESSAVELKDATGGDLLQAYGELASEQTGEMWVEGRGEREGAVLRLATVERALPVGESDPCARLPAAGELRASGNEPFWAISVTPAGLQLQRPDLEAPLVFPAAEPVPQGAGRAWTGRIPGDPPRELRLVVQPGRCKDSMSGAWSPLVAEASLDGETLAGCAHEGG